MSKTDTRAAFEAWMQTRPGYPFAGSFANLMWASWQAATEAAKVTSVAVGELFGYGSSEKKNCLLSKAQFESCAPKNRTAYDIPLYAHSVPKCEGCKGYGVITHVSGQTPDNYEECNEVCPECEGTGEAARQPAPASGVLKVVRGEICYKSEADDQSYGMWCPVTPAYSPAYPDGTEFCAALAATAAPVLSDEQIGEIADNFKFKDHWQSNAEAIRFARAIIAATNRSQP